MRLIEVDDAIDAVQDVVTMPLYEFSVMCDKLESLAVEISTAYDVEKVIEELKLKAFTAGEESNDDGCYTDGRFSAVPLDVAIEIVKRGGV